MRGVITSNRTRRHWLIAPAASAEISLDHPATSANAIADSLRSKLFEFPIPIDGGLVNS
jgi:hypothetical protein